MRWVSITRYAINSWTGEAKTYTLKCIFNWIFERFESVLNSQDEKLWFSTGASFFSAPLPCRTCHHQLFACVLISRLINRAITQLSGHVRKRWASALRCGWTCVSTFTWMTTRKMFTEPLNCCIFDQAVSVFYISSHPMAPLQFVRSGKVDCCGAHWLDQ